MQKQEKKFTPSKNALQCKGGHLYEFGWRISKSDYANTFYVQYCKKCKDYEILDDQGNYQGGFMPPMYQKFESFVRSTKLDLDNCCIANTTAYSMLEK